MVAELEAWRCMPGEKKDGLLWGVLGVGGKDGSLIGLPAFAFPQFPLSLP